MSAKPLRTRSKSASAERCLRPLGATIDMATPDPKTSNGFSVQGIFAWGFAKRQPGGRGGYRVLSLSGNCWKKSEAPLRARRPRLHSAYSVWLTQVGQSVEGTNYL